MQEANAASIEFLRDSRRVADLLNGVIFHGKPVIMETDLQEKDPVIHKIINTGHKLTATENTLDLSVNVTVDSVKFLLMLQLQTHEHHAMPVRILNERGTDYYNQWKIIQKKHREMKDLRNGEEFLSGIGSQEYFYPVLHITVYFGKKPWTAARKMDDLFPMASYPRELQKLFTEKPILICDIRHFKHPEWFQTDLRQVCGFLRNTEDTEKLKRYVEENAIIFSNLPEDTYNLLMAMDGERNLELIKRDVQNERGGFDMCKAFREMIEEGRKRGIEQGIQQGIEQGIQQGRLEEAGFMGQLIRKLIQIGRTDDLLAASEDREYCERLMKEFGIIPPNCDAHLAESIFQTCSGYYE